MTIPLDPAEWLLDYDAAVHDGNRITPLIDGADYFAELITELYSLGPDDFFYCAGWAIDADVWLDSVFTFRNALDAAAANQARRSPASAGAAPTSRAGGSWAGAATCTS